MTSLYKQFAAVVILLALFIVTIVLPDINRTNRLIAGDNLLDAVGVPKPSIYDGE